MCGIMAYIQGIEPEHQNAVEEVRQGLRRLVYRGYDSWGYATDEGYLEKNLGEVPDTPLVGVNPDAVIGHTRWATHGGVTKENAHPHESCRKLEEPERRFAVVHNGIIENHEELKNQLKSKHTFTSETDTEVIPHFLEHHTQAGRTTAEALHLFDEEAQGNYAIVVLDREEEQLYGLRRGSPLVFAYPMTTESSSIEHPKGAYFSSDLYAISDKCDKAYFMEDGDIIMTSGSNLAIMEDGEWKQGFKNENWKSFEWTEEEPVLGGDNRYWMEKEIKEIPEALNRLEDSMVNEQYDTWKKMAAKIKGADKVILTASGTSYHAALLGVYYLQQNDVDAQALIASEFENYERVTEDTLLLAISQSGETRDVLDAIQTARDEGAEIASLVNVPYSTIQRKSDISLEIKAQQENCVAATKTFTNQVYTLMNLAGIDVDGISKNVEKTMKETAFFAFEDAAEFHEQGHEDIYIIGNASTYPIAREIALKLKEISYIHAEGMMAGELKHGTLALIEEGTPVITLDDGTGNIESNIEEVEARGARTKKLSKNKFDGEHDFVFNATVYGFYLAMYWGHLKKLPVDRPRNLAKSVTVK